MYYNNEKKNIEYLKLSKNHFAYSLKTQKLVCYQDLKEDTICSCATCNNIVFTSKKGFLHPVNINCRDSFYSNFELAVAQVIKEIKFIKILNNTIVNSVYAIPFLNNLNCLLLETSRGRIFAYIKMKKEVPSELKLNAVAKKITMIVMDFTTEDDDLETKDCYSMNSDDIKLFLLFSENQYFLNNALKTFNHNDYYLHFLYEDSLNMQPVINEKIHGEYTFCIGTEIECKNWISSMISNYPIKDIAFVPNNRIKLISSNKNFWTILENYLWEKKDIVTLSTVIKQQQRAYIFKIELASCQLVKYQL